MARHKRPRGAPLGNQNARKHGFYAENLTPQETLKFWNTVNVQRINPTELALQTKIACALQNAPGNTRVLLEASRLLSKFFLTQNDLTEKEYTAVKKIFRNVFKAFATGDEKLAEQVIAESLEMADKIQNK